MNQQPTRRIQRFVRGAVLTLLIGATFGAGMVVGGASRSVWAAERPPQFAVFWEVWDLVEAYFVDRGAIDPARMTYGAIQGMLATLGDENHTAFFSPEEATQQEAALEGSFEGIGAYVEQAEELFRIIAPIRGSPAEKAGILAGDIVLRVDGKPVKGLPEWEIISRIRGPAGTTVVLTVLHPDSEEPVDISIVRGQIEVDSVTWARIPQTKLVYLQIAQFAEDTGSELQRALEGKEDEYLRQQQQIHAKQQEYEDLRHDFSNLLERFSQQSNMVSKLEEELRRVSHTHPHAHALASSPSNSSLSGSLNGQ